MNATEIKTRWIAHYSQRWGLVIQELPEAEAKDKEVWATHYETKRQAVEEAMDIQAVRVARETLGLDTIKNWLINNPGIETE